MVVVVVVLLLLGGLEETFAAFGHRDMVLMSENWCTGSSGLSLQSLVVGEESMQSVGDFSCLGSMF